MEDDYCPIKKNGICGANNMKCNHEDCFSKIHYGNPTKLLNQKMEKWRKHRRGEVRWKD